MTLLSKRDIRIKAAAMRDALTKAEIAERGKTIEDRLFAFEPFAAARTVMLFVSFRSEVPTSGIIRRSLAAGKRVVVPAVSAAEHVMIASEIKDFDAELAPGAYGIMEPKPDFIRPVPPEEIDFVALPGLAFDRCGNRIGYGGGYYDRFIAALCPETTLVALAFSLQIFDEIPVSENDRQVHAIVTDKELLLLGV
jgi:5-formyltetrahydrofolate cyclo-ligase